MKLVIEIPKEYYEALKEMSDKTLSMDMTIIKYGTPLPEHHGRLIDENELIDEIECEEIDGRYYDIIYAHSIYDAPTIIEAESEEV